MLEILNSNQYASPIIVFVNQKKTADMVAKDLQRAGVSVLPGSKPYCWMSTVLTFPSIITVERGYTTLGQESGSARGSFASPPNRRCRYPRCH